MPNTPNQNSEFDLRHITHVLRRRVVMIVLVMSIAFAGVYLYSSTQPDLYRAAAEVRAIDSAGVAVIALETNQINATRELATQIHTIRSRALAGRVNSELGSDADLVESVSVSAVEETDVVRITTTSRSPEVAAAAANTFADVYVQDRQLAMVGGYREQAQKLRSAADRLRTEIEEIDTALAANPSAAEADALRANRTSLVQQQSDLRILATNIDLEADLRNDSVAIIDPATVPGGPFAPRPLRDAVLAAAVAAVFAVGLAFVLDWADRRITSPRNVESVAGGIPVLGAIPINGDQKRRLRPKLPRDRALVPRNSAAMEAYRTLQTSLRFSSLGKAKQRIAVTSSSGGEGKTTVTANLAMVLAETGLRVVVVSADLRRPMIGSLFGIDESERGLTSVLLGDAPLAECLVPVRFESGRSLYLLPAGPLPHNPAELLGSSAFATVLERIEAAGVDFILLDCAPVLPVSDPLAVAQHVDGVIVLALAERTKQHNLAQTIDRLKQVEVNIIGVVLNGVPHRRGYYGYYGYYGYEQRAYNSSNGGNGNGEHDSAEAAGNGAQPAAATVTTPTEPIDEA